jgi:Cu2+-exporting ATPase
MYRIGSAAFVAELRNENATAICPAELSGSLIMLGDEQQALAWFELTDSLRPAAADAVHKLRSLHIQPLILSGDGHAAVAAIAQQCDITEYFARRSAEQKLAQLQALQRDGKRVAVIGDGVNDAPVLGAADVSIAMGRGAALAHASAGLVLVNDNLAALPEAVRLVRRTLQIARQNLLWAAIYNFGSLPLAALGFIPPWLAALGMSISSVAVVLNSTRLLPRTPRQTAGPSAKAIRGPLRQIPA